jgi:hypothetical protein
MWQKASTHTHTHTHTHISVNSKSTSLKSLPKETLSLVVTIDHYMHCWHFFSFGVSFRLLISMSSVILSFLRGYLSVSREIVTFIICVGWGHGMESSKWRPQKLPHHIQCTSTLPQQITIWPILSVMPWLGNFSLDPEYIFFYPSVSECLAWHEDSIIWKPSKSYQETLTLW